jgi:hypothetical protein
VWVAKAYHVLAVSYSDDPVALDYYNAVLKYDSPYVTLLCKGHYLLRNSYDFQDTFDTLLKAWQQVKG